MKKQERLSLPAIGAGSLLVSFAVLCLTVFALLSLTTARAEQRMAEASSRTVTAYYEADLRAEEIFARLRGGETVPGVEAAEDIYTYSCPIAEGQTLEVQLHREGEVWTVLRWQAVAQPEQADDILPVWDGK